MNHIQIIETVSSSSLTQPHKYFIDVPVDIEMFEPDVRRIEIPRELAKYIRELQSKVLSLQIELERRNT